MLCANGHMCADGSAFCPTCGVGMFHSPAPQYPAYPAPAASPSTNGLAIASLVLGITWDFWIGSILALILGVVAQKQIKQNAEAGSGMATAGIILGSVGIATLLYFFIAVIAAIHSTGPSY